MNSVVLIGRLTKDPELSYTPNTQTAVTRFTIAVDRPKRSGEDTGADFIRITVFGKQADICNRYLAKGRQVAINGRIQTGSYKNRDGVTVYTTDVVANNVEFLGSGNSANGGSRMGGSEVAPQTGFAPAGEDVFPSFDDLPDSFQQAEDDMPF